jgi:aspartyl-tRNA(Asn)/glutamyl-tRNA(Gln) amidotransferase subunit B
LPVPNKKAIDWTVLMGLALKCNIPLFSKFDRKNYFYPDLPKGYQISQYEEPFCLNGKININSNNTKRTIRIRRVHLEEDTTKLIHAPVDGKEVTLINFNRSGVPLMEIVTEPDFHDALEVKDYLKKLQQLVRYIQISDGDMEKGSMRLEANISLAKEGATELPNYRVEVKNLNSFRFVEKAIQFEITRQARLLDQGITPDQETRGYNADKNLTYVQRSKEEAKDYRYFPEPDIPPICWQESQIREIFKQLPELPEDKIKRYISQYNLSEYQANILIETPAKASQYEQAIKDNPEISPKDLANALINKREIKKSTQPETDINLDLVISEILSTNPNVIAEYKKGKVTSIEFLLGQVMRLTHGQANANLARQLLVKKLS